MPQTCVDAGRELWRPPDSIKSRLHLEPRHWAFLERYLAVVQERHADDVLRIRAYGSRVRGNVHQDSDLDLLAIVRDGVSEFVPVDLAHDICMDMFENHPCLLGDVDVMGFEHRHWLKLLRQECLYPHVVEEEGLDLHWSHSLPERAYSGVGSRPPINMVYD